MVVKLNFESKYKVFAVTEDLSEASFCSFDWEGYPVLLKIRIKSWNSDSMPYVYNLAYGPPQKDGTVDDRVRIHHQELSKVFSTIILHCLNFLQAHPDYIIGLDGSNDTRAYLYHRMFKTNADYLKGYLTSLGADWFVRVLRNGELERDEDGELKDTPKLEAFNYQRSTKDLYTYYLFHLVKQQIKT